MTHTSRIAGAHYRVNPFAHVTYAMSFTYLNISLRRSDDLRII